MIAEKDWDRARHDGTVLASTASRPRPSAAAVLDVGIGVVVGLLALVCGHARRLAGWALTLIIASRAASRAARRGVTLQVLPRDLKLRVVAIVRRCSLGLCGLGTLGLARSRGLDRLAGRGDLGSLGCLRSSLRRGRCRHHRLRGGLGRLCPLCRRGGGWLSDRLGRGSHRSSSCLGRLGLSGLLDNLLLGGRGPASSRGTLCRGSLGSLLLEWRLLLLARQGDLAGLGCLDALGRGHSRHFSIVRIVDIIIILLLVVLVIDCHALGQLQRRVVGLLIRCNRNIHIGLGVNIVLGRVHLQVLGREVRRHSDRGDLLRHLRAGAA
eukprot:m.21310 g.21310  ORF g.21310 m.21310 type:complete len:324 (-) comp3614_c0_seq1:1487-2458(-)